MSSNVEPEKGRTFELGDFRVEPGLDRLSRGPERLAIEPRAMDLLVCLARRAGETVAKETLLEEVWKGAFVVEGVISKTVSALRSTLGDDASEPTYILTVPRRGYRLIAPVRWLDPAGASPIAPASPPTPPVVPLPRVAGAESATAEPETKRASAGAGGDDPRVRRRGRFVVAIVGLSMVGILGWLFHASGKRMVAESSRSGSRVSESVERLLLEARNLWAQRGIDSVRRANELLLQAVKEAPESAEVRGWLALSFITRASYLGGGAEACEQAAEQVDLALDLDPDSPIALCAKGVLAINRDLEAKTAIAAQQRAVALDPTFVPARQFLAEALSIAGQNARALQVIDQALALEPLSAVLHGVKGLILLRSDRPLAALAAYERVLVLEPQFTWAHHNRGMSLARLGREREAAEAFYSEAELYRERPEFLATLRAAIDQDGLSGYWRWRLGRFEASRKQGIEPSPIRYAEALAGAGHAEEALVELAKPPACPNAEYFFYLRDSPAFDGLRNQPRFRAIYASYPR